MPKPLTNAVARAAFRWLLPLLLMGAVSVSLGATEDEPLHGLWVWSGPSILRSPEDLQRLTHFCQAQGVNEVYLAVTERGEMMDPRLITQAIELLHHSGVRVAALLSSESADEPGKHRQKLLDAVTQIVDFNRSPSRERFDGIHLDIEPQQRPENKGAGNLRFLPGLTDAYRAAAALAGSAGLPVEADIGKKLLEGNPAEREMLLSSLPRFNLMLYELSSPDDGRSTAEKSDKVQQVSEKLLAMAYSGLRAPHLATIVIGLRTPDYGPLLPAMLDVLDATNHANPHYAGWARHSYNDTLHPD